MSHPLAAAVAALPTARTAHASLRAHLDTLADFATDLDRERRASDPLGTDPAFEGVRQRQRAIQRTAQEVTEKLDYLALALSNLTDDLAQWRAS